MSFCNKCGVELTDENWNKGNKRIHSMICKFCSRKQINDYRHKDIEKSRFQKRKAWHKYHTKNIQNKKEQRKKAKIEIISHYTNGTMMCVGWNGKGCPYNCNDVRCLSIDHINGGGLEHRRELIRIGINFYNWLKKNNYPSGYQVLCMNCQFIKRYENNEFRGGHPLINPLSSYSL